MLVAPCLERALPCRADVAGQIGVGLRLGLGDGLQQVGVAEVGAGRRALALRHGARLAVAARVSLVPHRARRLARRGAEARHLPLGDAGNRVRRVEPGVIGEGRDRHGLPLVPRRAVGAGPEGAGAIAEVRLLVGIGPLLGLIRVEVAPRELVEQLVAAVAVEGRVRLPHQRLERHLDGGVGQLVAGHQFGTGSLRPRRTCFLLASRKQSRSKPRRGRP